MLALCESLSFREWSGYYAVSAYETHHEHEYNAIRNRAALATPFLDLTDSVSTGSEQGLLGMAFAPDYGSTGRSQGRLASHPH